MKEGYNARLLLPVADKVCSCKDVLIFFSSHALPVNEYARAVFRNALPHYRSDEIKLQKHALRIICPYNYFSEGCYRYP